MRQTPHAYEFGVVVSNPEYWLLELGKGKVLPPGLRPSSRVSAMGSGGPPKKEGNAVA